MTEIESVVCELQRSGKLSPGECIAVLACVQYIHENKPEKFIEEYGTFSIENVEELTKKRS